MLKLISGFLIGFWFAFVIVSCTGAIDWGFFGILITGIFIAIIVGALYIVDLILDYKNMYKNTQKIAAKGMSLFSAWNTYKMTKKYGKQLRNS